MPFGYCIYTIYSPYKKNIENIFGGNLIKWEQHERNDAESIELTAFINGINKPLLVATTTITTTNSAVVVLHVFNGLRQNFHIRTIGIYSALRMLMKSRARRN